MTENKQRLLLPGLLALCLHGGLLCWQPSPGEICRPAPLPVQRIAVSLDAAMDRPAKPEKEIQEPVRKEAPQEYSKAKVVPSPPPSRKTASEKPPPPEPSQQKTETARPEPESAKRAEAPSLPAALPSSPPTAQVIQKATPLYQINPPPPYPRQARRRGFEGFVLLSVLVDEKGAAAEVAVFRSSGHAILDEAALKAVRHWRFKAGSVNGRQTPMRVTVPVRFQLQ